MRRLCCIIIACIATVQASTFGQSVSFAGDDEKKRGYYDRPYRRYEAEPNRCTTSGLFLSPTTVQTELQSEASNAVATQLAQKGMYVEWKNEEPADGMVVRFSIPDSREGKGLEGIISLYVNGKFVRDIQIDSRQSWQYALFTGQTYPDNIPAANKFARMRFDEVRLRLTDRIPKGATFRIVKADDNDIPYTIDFVELEAVPPQLSFESIRDDNKIRYSGEVPLDRFITENEGKTVYIPAGRYEVKERIIIRENGTKIIGAGMWYTEIYFSAPSDNAETYAKRGIQASGSNIIIDGLYLSTSNDRRYYVFNGRDGQVGKGLMGSFGSNSTIRNVWAEHFECGGWIDGANSLTVSHCRFRNNYADGINLSFGSKNSTVEHCSFRNNGDDDMASWSRGQQMCESITYSHCTAENNWRASSVGFFGGKNNRAINIVVIDPMEAALRITTDFPGREFSSDGMTVFDNISVYKGGCRAGPLGYYGDIIDGSEAGAIHITAYLRYDIRNVRFSNIDLFDSRCDAIFIDTSNEKMIENLHLENINIHGAGRNGISFNKSVGEIFLRNINYEKITGQTTGALPRWLKIL